MNQRLVGWVRQGTGMGFTAGLLLIALGVAGQSATFALAVGVLAIGVVGTAMRQTLRERIDHPGFAAYLVSIPLGPLVAGVVLVVFLGASPGELQTLGGVLGLLALLNHLFRPVYAFGHYVVSRLAGTFP
ncbi:hypothetical protein [Halorhabdus amylolytica]|uniref:hypothetical protein n=1 Tax=Halorhabdus amylolytica TaxID=2559573 RepID=UPI0010AAC35B|nr:hypothetical protein [Halorhabdus amylolytica]